MRLLLGLIIPTLSILAPLAILIWIGRRQNRLNRTDFVVTIFCCFLVGLIVPVVATYLSVYGFMYNLGPDDPRCATGVISFLFYGYLINLIGVPITGLVLLPSKEGPKSLSANEESEMEMLGRR